MIKVRVKKGWEGEGWTGTEYCKVMVGQLWSVVVWDDEEDPECFKSAGLEEVS